MLAMEIRTFAFIRQAEKTKASAGKWPGLIYLPDKNSEIP
jgi:hypothetical protein